MKKRGKKAQSAMEYLLTYGWAILVVLLVISVLFYLGAFETKIINRCIIEAPFYCQDIIFQEDYVGFLIKSINVKSANINAIFIDGYNCDTFYDGGILINGIEGYNISESSLTSIWIGCKINQNNLTVGDKAIVDFNIIFEKRDGLMHSIDGSGFGIVEGGVGYYNTFTGGSIFTGNFYYVDKNFGWGCSNSNNGSINAPWCDIGYAASNDSIKSGDIVYVRGGVYEEFDIRPVSSGNSTDYITYSVFEDEEVIIKGSDTEIGFDFINVNYTIINSFKFEGFKEVIRLDNSYFNIISNNYISGWKDKGIIVIGESVENNIKNNTIRDRNVPQMYNGGYGIRLESNNNTIIRNQIFNLSLSGWDEGIYIDGDYNKIFNNIVYDSAYGLYLSDTAFNNNISNNVLQSSVYTLSFNNLVFNDIDYNIMYNKKMYEIDDTIPQRIRNTINQRDYQGGWISLTEHQENSGKNVHSSNMNPFFVDEDNYDFRLNKLSWAVDAGRRLNGDYINEKGHAIDVGVFELEQECEDSDSDGYYKDDYYENNNLCPGGRDCDDNNVDINPSVNEICDNIDNNCDGLVDEGNCDLVKVDGNNYYVSNNGEDYYNGLYPNYVGGINGPWKSIKYALHIYNRKKLIAGDTLYIGGGGYREIRIGKNQWGTNNTINSGNALNNITINNYNDENVMIKGSTLIERNWTQYDDMVYNTTVPIRYNIPNMLFEDGVLLSNDHKYGYEGFNMNKNNISEVNEPGEWFSNRTINNNNMEEEVNVYLWPTNSDNPENHVVEVTLDMEGFWFDNKKYLVFEGLNFSQFGATPISGFNISNSTIKDNSFIYTYGGVFLNNDYIQNCKPYEENNDYGHNVYTNNYFIGNIHGGRIQDDAFYNIIEGNIFMAGEKKLSSPGIIVRGGKNIIKNNIFDYEENKDDLWARDGLVLETGLSSNNRVENNTFIYTRMSIQGSNNNITNNIFYSPSENTSWAFEAVVIESSFYTNPENPCCYICSNYDEQKIHTNSTGNIFLNNLVYVWNPHSAFTMMYDIANNTIINNIIVSNYTLMSKIGISNNDSEMDYNFYVWLNPYMNESFYNEINNSIIDKFPGMNPNNNVNWDWRWNYNNIYRVNFSFWQDNLNRDVNSYYITNISELFVNISANNFTINNKNLLCGKGKNGANIGPFNVC